MTINFFKGIPSLDLLPTQKFARASQVALSQSNAAQFLLQYGHQCGNTEYLENLANFLTRVYRDEVKIENLLATSGASFGLQHCLSLLTRPGSVTRYAFFQNPTYHLVYRIFTDVGYDTSQFVGIPDTDTGLDVDYFQRFLETHLSSDDSNSSEYYTAVLYCVPTHANPTSSTLSPNKRRRLVELAKKYNVLLICDDVYDLLTFDELAPKRVVAYDLEADDGKPVVVSNCSYSKILAPGSRAGWIEAPPKIISKLGDCGSFISGGSPSTYSSGIISAMLGTDDPELSLEASVASLKVLLKDRLHRGLWKAIQQHLVPLGCSASLPKGGYFVWLQLPNGLDCTRLRDCIKVNRLQVDFGPGDSFSNPAEPQSHSQFIRLCFAHYTTGELVIGIKRLATGVKLALEEIGNDDNNNNNSATA